MLNFNSRKIADRLRNYFPPYFVLASIVTAVSLLSFNDPSASIVVVLLLVLFGMYFAFTGRLLESVLVLAVLSVALNISFQLTFLGDLYDPYVRNILSNYLVPSVHILDLVSMVSLSFFMWQLKIEKRLTKLVGNQLLWLFIGYFLFQVLLHFDLNVIINSFRFVLYPSVAISLALVSRDRDILSGVGVRRVLAAISLIMFLQLAVALLQYLGGQSLGLGWLGESDLVAGMVGSSFIEGIDGIHLRGYGTFPHPNVLAAYALGVYILAMFVIREYKAYGSLLGLLAMALVLVTFSRVVLLMFLLVSFFALVNRKVMFSLLPLGPMLPWFRSGASFTERFALIPASVSVLLDNWLVGTGLGESVRYIGQQGLVTAMQIPLVQPVHNILLHFLVEGGLGALIFLFALGYVACRWALTYVKRLSANIFLLVLLCVFVLGFFDHYLLTLPQGYFLLVILLTGGVLAVGKKTTPAV